MALEDRYRDAAYHALGGFQMLEENLKRYLGIFHGNVQLVLEPELVYNFSREDIDNEPLAKLAKRFSSVTANVDLIQRINIIRPKRNYLAHKALAVTYNPKMSEDDYHAAIRDLHKLSDEIADIMSCVLEESEHLLPVFQQKRNLLGVD